MHATYSGCMPSRVSAPIDAVKHTFASTSPRGRGIPNRCTDRSEA